MTPTSDSFPLSPSEIISSIPGNVAICAVTKTQPIAAIEKLLSNSPRISILGENRWPDCQDTFQHFSKMERHFIGPLQSNKLNKVLPLVDCIQSIDSLELIKKIQSKLANTKRTIKFCIQVNVSSDPAKQGLPPAALSKFIEDYLALETQNLQLSGLMTIGAQTGPAERQKYFADLRILFDKMNADFFSTKPLPILSMGMSEDYDLAIREGSTMVRLGRCLL